MTKDEIMKLEAGRELDALIHTDVMKCTYRVSDGSMDLLYDFADYADEGEYIDTSEHNGEYYVRQKRVPEYSTDIAAAWQVVEKILDLYSIPGYYGGERTGKFGLYVTRTRAGDFDKMYYQVYFSQQGGQDKKKPGSSNFGDTLEIAICRAALLAVLG